MLGLLLELQICMRGREVERRTFAQDSVRIGRDPKADISIDNPSVSWDHAILEKQQDGRYRLQDLESANGTYVNRQRVRKTFVREADVIGIGKFTFTVTYREDRRQASTPFSSKKTDVHVEPVGLTFALSRAEIDRLLQVSNLPPLVPPSTPGEGTEPEIELDESGSPAIRFFLSHRGQLVLSFITGLCVGFLLDRWAR